MRVFKTYVTSVGNWAQWRSYYGLKYSTNLPIILVFKVCLFCRQRNPFITSKIPISWYTSCGFCKHVFSKEIRAYPSRLDEYNVPFALLIDCVNPPRHFVFKLSKHESSNLRVFRPTPRHWLSLKWTNYMVSEFEPPSLAAWLWTDYLALIVGQVSTRTVP